jgi:predicted DNA-binding ribbon-helix-helix protein
MTNYIRTQVLLEKRQRNQLDEIAQNAGISFSELVRDFLDAQMRIRTYEDMRHAANQLRDDYANDGNLTEMSALDGEDFINA